MPYYAIVRGQLASAMTPPPAAKPLKHQLKLLLPPLVTTLHQGLRAWSLAGFSPGPMLAQRVYLNEQGALAFHFLEGYQPLPLTAAGGAPDLAGWLVLLDKWVETFVVLARARTVWPLEDLVSALPFLTPAYLPAKLVAHPPDNWEAVAQALATVVLDGPLQGVPTNRHWQQT
jgi:hypothetical protein